MIINNQLVAQGIDELYEHFKLMASKSYKYTIVFPENPMITEENRTAIQYNTISKCEENNMKYYI